MISLKNHDCNHYRKIYKNKTAIRFEIYCILESFKPASQSKRVTLYAIRVMWTSKEQSEVVKVTYHQKAFLDIT